MEYSSSVSYVNIAYTKLSKIWTRKKIILNRVDSQSYLGTIPQGQDACESLGRTTTLVLCRQSPLNLHQFCLTRGSKQLFLQDGLERHLTVFCIEPIVVYYVNGLWNFFSGGSRFVCQTSRKCVNVSNNCNTLKQKWALHVVY